MIHCKTDIMSALRVNTQPLRKPSHLSNLTALHPFHCEAKGHELKTENNFCGSCEDQLCGTTMLLSSFLFIMLTPSMALWPLTMWILLVSFRLNIHKKKVHCFTFVPALSVYEAELRCGMCVTLSAQQRFIFGILLESCFPFPCLSLYKRSCYWILLMAPTASTSSYHISKYIQMEQCVTKILPIDCCRFLDNVSCHHTLPRRCC